MSKGISNKKFFDLTRFSKSSFTLTFAIEILGMDVWHDCNEGWLDLGPCHQAMKIQYQLYPEQSFDLDILIWPHIAKIWCGGQYGYVRTWQFLERRWFAFSIRHAFPVRVLELMNHVVNVNCSMGFGVLSNNAKSDKNIEAFLPAISFGERRYFGAVLEKENTLKEFIQNLIWNIIEEKLPASHLDGIFNTPEIVTDIRHQDSLLFNVREIILNSTLQIEEELFVKSDDVIKSKDRRESKLTKEKEKKKVIDTQKEKFAISLSGEKILAGVGAVIAFETTGERPRDQSEVLVLISSNNLPAHDDLPIIFINIENLYDIPVVDFKKARISQLYTRWKLNDEEYESEKHYIKSKSSINLNDHHAIPLQLSKASETTAEFLENNFEIQLRGLRNPALLQNMKLYENDKVDQKLQSKNSNHVIDTLIAATRIDASILATNKSGMIRGDFPLYPAVEAKYKLGRTAVSTNDINSVRIPVEPDIIIQPSVVLDAQMTLEVSLGFVGCQPHDIIPAYSRLYCCSHDSKAIQYILKEVKNINDNLIITEDKNSLLTGFFINTWEMYILYVEGPKNGPISKIWDLTADFYPNLKPVFSCSEKYRDRIYSEYLTSEMPINDCKMFVPLNTLLGTPQVYVKPTLPVLAKQALLKIGRLVANKTVVIPFSNEMPNYEELESFKLELCMPPSLNLLLIPTSNTR